MEMRTRPAPNAGKWPLIALVAAVVAFLIGFGWQYMRARGLSGGLEVAERSATFNGLEGTLGAAAIEAQRGSYEIARQHASEFFSGLQSAVGAAPEAAAPVLQQMLGERDAMITTLSRSNPQAGPMLAQMFNRFRAAMGRSVGPQGTEPTTPPPVDSPVPADSPRDTTPPVTTTTGS
jgi:hypothetical protein